MATLKKMQENLSEIVEWYKGRNVLITGGTGFMGKVLLEKLLRSVPDIGNIYIIVKEKRGVAPMTRIQEIVKLPVFERIRSENPNALKKLIAVEGDITAENMGISVENMKIIQTEVSIVFHVAATLRLEATLKDSVIQNLTGTDNLFKFCQGIKTLEVILHLSTAFCHCDVDVLEEKIYEPTQSPQNIMNLVKWMDSQTLDKITEDIIHPHPNTYTFTKRLSEVMANDYGKKVPVVILRPSIVLPTMRDPIPGWVDNLNGPVGVLAAGGKGVIRSMLGDATNHAEVIPVDIAVNCMIITAWNRAQHKFNETPVYNMSQSDVCPITWGEVLKRGHKLTIDNPFEWPLWYPNGDIRLNKFIHYSIVILFQIIPAYFLDVIFLIIFQKRFMVKVQNRIWLGMNLLQYFTLREWKFKNERVLNMISTLNPVDMEIFYTNNIDINIDQYLKDIILGTRQYCLKENPKTFPKAKRYMTFLYILDRITKGLCILGLIWVLLKFSTSTQELHDDYYGLKLKI